MSRAPSRRPEQSLGSQQSRQILPLAGLAAPVLFTAVTILCAALRPDYDHASQFISELGATRTPHATLMNVAGFTPSGLLFALFGLSLARALPHGAAFVAVSVLMTLFGIGLAAAGVFSCDAGCPLDGSTEALVHDRVSIAAFLSAIAGVGLFGRAVRRAPGWRELSGYSLLSSALAFVFLAALVASVESRTLTGLWQRLMLGTLFLWCVVVGVRASRAPTGSV